MWGGSYHLRFVLPPPPLPAPRVRVLRLLLETQDYRVFSFARMCPVDVLLSPEPEGDPLHA